MAKKIWERLSPGQPPKFNSPDELWAIAKEYFEYCEQNPLMEAKAFSFQGSSWIEEVPKMRAMTLNGVCSFANIARQTWYNYKEKPEYLDVCTAIENAVYEQKFSGAAADLLNASIIARDLGLSDRKDLTSSDGSMTPKATNINITPEMAATDAATAYRELMEDDS